MLEGCLVLLIMAITIKRLFHAKCCFLSFNLVLSVILFFTLDSGRTGCERKNSEAC